MSLWFYGYYNPGFLPLIIASFTVNYGLYLLMGRAGEGWIIKLISVLGVTFNLLLLAYFKYYDFLLENLSRLTGADFVLRGIILPLGISFYTFQQIGFILDSKKQALDGLGDTGELRKKGTAPGGNIEAHNDGAACREIASPERYSFSEYALFVTFFPQLVAGPIVTHEEMIGQFRETQRGRFNKDYFAAGLFCFSMGLGKKILIADVIGRSVDACYGMDHFSGGTLAAAILISAYSLQLYFDFSGYCDMARGLGFMFGVRIPSNFNSPYRAKDPGDFWNRWHMTLGRFFTKYVYIPLGGNRRGLPRTCVNIMIVFFLSGLWHGAGWTFVIWGLIHGAMNVAHRVYITLGTGRGAAKSSLITGGICNLITIIFVCLLWVIFRAGSMDRAVEIVSALIPSADTLTYLPPQLTEGYRVPEFFYILKVMTSLSPERIDLALMWIYIVVPWGLCLFAPSLSSMTEDFKPTAPKAILSSLVFVWALVSIVGVSSFLYFNF